MILNDLGIMIERQWQELIYRFDNIKADKFKSIGISIFDPRYPIIGAHSKNVIPDMKIRFRRCSVAARKVMDIVSTGVFIMIVIPNHFHGIVKFVGVPLVGTRNSKQPPQMGQSLPTPMGQPSSSPLTGQPQGIAPTGGNAEK